MSSGDREIELQQGTLDLISEATFYSLTRAGARALAEQAERWRRLVRLVGKLLLEN